MRAGGMETPVSLMLLVLAALAIGSVMAVWSDDGSDEDISGVRLVQAGSLSFTLSNYVTPEGEDISLLVGKERLHVWRNEGGVLTFSRDPGRAERHLRLLLNGTPDGLEASILFSMDPEDIPDLMGGRFSRQADLGGGMVLTITLPHHRGSMRSGEVSH